MALYATDIEYVIAMGIAGLKGDAIINLDSVLLKSSDDCPCT